MKKASDIQKQRIKEIEEQANVLLEKCNVCTLASINENGYPRICTVSKLASNSFMDLFFITSKRSKTNGKATHFENNSHASVCYFLGGDSVTLIGDVEFITERCEQEKLWNENDRRFFPKGLDDPKLRILHFHTVEATFWIGGKFRTCKY